jgi:hypothetical protein
MRRDNGVSIFAKSRSSAFELTSRASVSDNLGNASANENGEL